MAKLVPDPHQGLDVGRAHPQPLLQQLLPGWILPVLVLNVDSQGTVPGPHSMDRHLVYRVLTPFKMRPA